MEMIFDDFDAQIQCEDVQPEYVPTEQDLLDMESAFSVTLMTDSEFESMIQSLENIFGGLDNPF